MRRKKIPEVTNALIAGLRPKARREFLRRAELVELACGDVLCEVESPLSHVYFPLTGYLSRLVIIDGKLPLDMGFIGNEGMLGSPLAINVVHTRVRVVVHRAGTTLRMTVPAFRRALREVPGLLSFVQRYLNVTIVQLARSAACARFHAIEQRLAGWLLMVQDCADADHFHITQGLLAEKLGVRRVGVTVAAGELKRKKLIRYSRGEVVILNRRGLEAAACSCYAALMEELSDVPSSTLPGSRRAEQ